MMLSESQSQRFIEGKLTAMPSYKMAHTFKGGIAILSAAGEFNEHDWRQGWLALFADPAYAVQMPIIADFTQVHARVHGFAATRLAMQIVADLVPASDHRVLIAVVNAGSYKEDDFRTIRVVAENANDILNTDGKKIVVRFFANLEAARSWVAECLADGGSGFIGDRIFDLPPEGINADKIREGIQNDEFYLVFQPQYNLTSRETVGCEALLRWKGADGKIIPPSEFIPIAEKRGIIRDLDEFAFRKALRQAKIWRQQYLRAPRIGVNISALHIEQDDFVGRTLMICEEEGVNLDALDIEITEQTILTDHSGVAAKMKYLGGYGCTFSIDDFGTGYSSLAYLKALPISRIKIDQIFVRNVESDSANAVICDAIVKLSDAFGCQTIAEGIETVGAELMLKELGCEEGQGYFFSKPVESQDMTRFIPKYSGLKHQKRHLHIEGNIEDRLPSGAIAALDIWRALAVRSVQKVDIVRLQLEFLRRELCDFSMIYEMGPDGVLTYQSVGKRLLQFFNEDPIGKPLFFYHASEFEQKSRRNLIEASLRTGKPFWYEGPTLFDNRKIEFGRLGLPGVSGERDALLIIYFQIMPVATGRDERAEIIPANETFWLTA